MKKEIECNIKGRVVMVMFRDFAQRKAKSLNLVGTAKNLKDNSVQIIAQGEKEKLEKYISFLKKGPILARVDDISVFWKEPIQKFDGFRIMYD
jgi:acylphosphatase